MTTPANPQAAAQVATQDPDCVAIAPFYWEIGDTTQVLASGSTGNGSVTRDTTMAIASSSKWVFAAYVVERLQGQIDDDTHKKLTLSSGYTSFVPTLCGSSTTVQDCEDQGQNARYTADHDGKFYYGGGHDQKWAVDHAMAQLTNETLVGELESQLGADLDMTWNNPQMAGGLIASAKSYAGLLRKMLSGQLHIGALLGKDAVCTLPASCPTAGGSPVPEAFHYSYGHWVEDDPTNGDGAFDSAGALGFYPWINANKTLYGVISRKKAPAPGASDIGEGWASALCGRKIRKAFSTP
jgi:hypothetical protein